jgi:hypothetical protein
MKIYNALALPALLYGCEIWAVREQDKCRITSTEMKLMRSITKYTRQDYKTSEGILSKLKTNPVVKKIQNYGNKWIQHARRMDRDKLPHLIAKHNRVGNEAKDDPSKDFSAVNGTGTSQEA